MNGMSSEDLAAKAAEFAKKAEQNMAAGGEEISAPPTTTSSTTTTPAPSKPAPAAKAEPG
jgi:hypothetical protein